ncbi:hypothetical protein CW304_14455 [Bacillus sp. UFRGS-B20]|nr:hypothetical protein CW304_14455 [Bacillus sp. UFRGS-B20]
MCIVFRTVENPCFLRPTPIITRKSFSKTFTWSFIISHPKSGPACRCSLQLFMIQSLLHPV